MVCCAVVLCCAVLILSMIETKAVMVLGFCGLRDWGKGEGERGKGEGGRGKGEGGRGKGGLLYGVYVGYVE